MTSMKNKLLYIPIVVILLIGAIYFVWSQFELKSMAEEMKVDESEPAPIVSLDPKFTDYPVQEVFSGISSPLDLKSSPIGMQFRTRITEDYVGVPDFAGHYTIAWWGCGVICHSFVIIDNKTGKILGDYTSEKLMDYQSYYGMDYKLESSLLVLNPVPKPDSDYAQSMTEDRKDFFEQQETRYYKWENNEFILIQ